MHWNIEILLTLMLALLYAAHSVGQCFVENSTVPDRLSLGPSNVKFTSCESGADSPRVTPVNGTTYDWWYFDAIAKDGSQSLVVIFFTASCAGFEFTALSCLTDSMALSVYIFADHLQLPIALEADSAHIETVANGASGTWIPTGASFQGSPDLSQYTIQINNDARNIHGTMRLRSLGPPHYSCSTLQPAVDEQIVPGVGWVNIIPIADADVDMNIAGTAVKFESGTGYHDKNWGDRPFSEAVESWYWGHASFGDNNIVFLDAIAGGGQEWATGYDVVNGRVVGLTCSNIQVRPIGTPFPPQIGFPAPTGFTLNMTLDDGSKVDAVLTPSKMQLNLERYRRWTGTINANVKGATQEGIALWEEFRNR